MSSITVSDPRGQWGFMSPLYPSPFVLDGQRWRSLEHWIQASRVTEVENKDKVRTATSPFRARALGDELSPGSVDDEVLWRGLVAKFNANPELLSQLTATGRSRIESSDPLYPHLGSLLEKLRASIASPLGENRDRDLIMGNLYALLKAQGYTHISRQRNPWEPVALEQASLSDVMIGMMVRGQDMEAVVDIFLDQKFDRGRVVQMIKEIWDPRPRPPHWDPDLKRSYIIVAQMDSRSLNELLRITAFRDVKIFSPAQLHIRPSQHILSPSVRRLQSLPEGLEPSKIPSISVNDVLIKELGLRVGDIIEVNDFSPHYRLVV